MRRNAYALIAVLLLAAPSIADTVKISELPAATTIAGADILVGVQGGVTKQIPYSVILPSTIASSTTGNAATCSVAAAGDSATSFFSSGTLEIGLIPTLTDALIPNNITIDFAAAATSATTATTATTALAGDSATNFFPSGTLEIGLIPTLTDALIPNNITIDTATTAATATTASDLTCADCVGGTEILESSLVGVGNVVGPASATDNYVAVFDGATGKLVKETGEDGFAYWPNAAALRNNGGITIMNGGLFVTHQAFSGVDNWGSPTGALWSVAPDYRAGTGSTVGGTLNLYQGAVLFASTVNAVNSHNVMLANEYDGELEVGSPDAAFDPRAFSTGGLKTGVVTKTADYVLTANDYTLRCDATSGAVNFTLPAIVAQTRRRIYRLKKVDSSGNACTFTRSGSDTIDGATTAATSTQYVSIEVQAPDAGVDWMKF